MLLNFSSKNRSSGDSSDFRFNFNTTIHSPLDNTGKPVGKISLNYLSFYNKIKNTPNGMTITFDTTGGDSIGTNYTITFTSNATWTISEIFDEIDRQFSEQNLNDTSGPNTVKPFELGYNEALSKFYLKINFADNVEFSGGDAPRVFGYGGTPIKNSSYLQNEADLFLFDHLVLNSSFTESSRQNGVKSEAIAVIPLNSPSGGLIIYEPKTKNKIYVDREKFTNARFYFTTLSGEPVHFVGNPTVNISLHLSDCGRADFCMC